MLISELDRMSFGLVGAPPWHCGCLFVAQAQAKGTQQAKSPSQRPRAAAEDILLNFIEQNVLGMCRCRSSACRSDSGRIDKQTTQLPNWEDCFHLACCLLPHGCQQDQQNAMASTHPWMDIQTGGGEQDAQGYHQGIGEGAECGGCGGGEAAEKVIDVIYRG
jgi:hypothetical protein